MGAGVRSVLFICTGNSARSIIAEALLNAMAGQRCTAYSAGSHPKGTVHPMALQTLANAGVPTDGLRSKSWDEFAKPGAPKIDLIITVCDQAAGEACPLWSGHPITAHWGMPDPAAVEREDEAKAFLDTLVALKRRLEFLLALPMLALEVQALRQQVQDIASR